MKPLTGQWKSLFKTFIQHFEEEMKVIEDKTLDKELQQLLDIYQLEEKVDQAIEM